MYAIGIDIGGTNLKAGLVDERGGLVSAEKIPLRWEGPEKFVADLLALGDRLLEQQGLDRGAVSSVGMGVPGVVDHRRGTIVKTTNIPIRDLPVAEWIQRSWPVPVHLGNDADCAAWGEDCHFSHSEEESLVLVTLGTGIGTGLVLGGRLHRGCNGCAGEGGHIVIVPGGELCSCGRRGCWERYASASALVRQTRAAMAAHPDAGLWEIAGGDPSNVDGRTAFEGLRRGDAVARQVVEQYLDYLAEGVTDLINLLQPTFLCIGGGLSHEDDAYLLHPLRRRVEAMRFDRDLQRHTEICKAVLGNDAGIIGAALLGRL